MTNRLTVQCDVLSFTLYWLKAHVVYFMNMPQHKWVAADNMTIWPDGEVTVMKSRQTTDYTNARFIAVCCGIENHVITPCAILFHDC